MFGETKEFNPLYSKPNTGEYAIDSDDIKWERCRERLAISFDQDTKGLYLCYPEGKFEDIATFVNKIENTLFLAEQSVFSKTTILNIMWIKIAPFWKDCYMKRSFFTMLPRAGFDYSTIENNYEQALFKYPFLRDTKRAVMRFLFGFTKYVGTIPNINPQTTLLREGWVHYFQNKDDAYIRSQLLFPNEKKASPVAVNTLWG